MLQMTFVSSFYHQKLRYSRKSLSVTSAHKRKLPQVTEISNCNTGNLGSREVHQDFFKIDSYYNGTYRCQ